MQYSSFAKILSLVALVAMVVFVLAPLSWMVSGAFKTSRELISQTPSLRIENPSTASFKRLAESDFRRYFVNSLAVATVTALVTTFVAAMTGYALARSKRRIVRLVGDLSLFSYTVAPIMLAIPFVVIIKRLQLADTLTGLAVSHFAFCLPFAVWTLWAFFSSLPVMLEDQGVVDGLSVPSVIRRVIVPLSAPGVVATFIFVFALSWNDYVFARVLIGASDKKTLPIGIEDMFSTSYVDWSLIMAAGVVMLIPSLLLVSLMQRHVRQTWFRGWQ